MLHVLGSINLDLIATGERLPLAGETVIGEDFFTAPGGKGANQALAAARAGADVKMFGAIGNDRFAPLAMQELKKENIALSGVKNLVGTTGIALIMLNAQSENTIMVIPGANGKVDAEMARQCTASMSGSDHLVLVQEIPAAAIKTALKGAKSRGATSILNIAPAIPETKKLALFADIIIANETEILHLFEKNVPEEMIEQYAAEWAKNNNKILILTLGKKGAIAFFENKKIKVEALKIRAIDTVGAGDSFCGYLAAGLDQGNDLKTSLVHGVTAGSLACLKPSAQGAIPRMEDVKNAIST
ncbi:Ribokinase [hydrothermal vent metagenome]|uniref:Ribokinase n=1 Tax=hydrothermal vent metagenome TaxID=652676 RepID=A0A3B0T901_9ZZZZ